MKLFVWRDNDVLKNYSSGITFALSTTPNDARNLIRTEYRKYLIGIFGDYEYTEEKFTDDMRCLDAEPEVFSGPVGFFHTGGE